MPLKTNKAEKDAYGQSDHPRSTVASTTAADTGRTNTATPAKPPHVAHRLHEDEVLGGAHCANSPHEHLK